MAEGVLHYHCYSRLYRDSVALMALAAELESLDGVLQAGAMMATAANQRILKASGMMKSDLAVEADDLYLAVRATSPEAAAAALEHADTVLTAKTAQVGDTSLTFKPATIAEACELVDAQVAAISVPGAYAASVAQSALNQGLHVFCFSDNVSVEDESALKAFAAKRKLLMMGPDCGTALLAGTPLGFANEVELGSVALVAASGTGAQEISTLASKAGVGISHIIGVGGRDLSGKIDFPTTFTALDLLDQDPAVSQIVIVSKPPAPEMIEKLVAHCQTLSKPVMACLLGAPETNEPIAIYSTLERAAHALIEACGKSTEALSAYQSSNLDKLTPAPGAEIYGLYTGGTLAHEAHILCDNAGVRNTILDLGDDEYTQGRPHPMISPDLRCQMIEKATDTKVLLLDVVLGWGASHNPAADAARAVKNLRQNNPAVQVLASITGTDRDHQNIVTQRELLQEAGIAVFESNGAAVRRAIELVGA